MFHCPSILFLFLDISKIYVSRVKEVEFDSHLTNSTQLISAIHAKHAFVHSQAAASRQTQRVLMQIPGRPCWESHVQLDGKRASQEGTSNCGPKSERSTKEAYKQRARLANLFAWEHDAHHDLGRLKCLAMG